MKSKSASLFAVCAFCSMAVAVSAQAGEPVGVGKTETLTATVKSIDLNKRLVELQAGDRSATVEVPKEVRNLAQVKVGDSLVVHYHQGLAAEFKPKGESKTTGVVDVTKETARAQPGAKPGAITGQQVTTTVVIESVDRSANSVTFKGPAGMTRTVDVKDPKAQAFIKGLKQGDEVELTYSEALAVTIEPKTKQ